MYTMNYELLGILITVVIQALYIAYKIGKFEAKLDSIEEKTNKHNSVIERTFMNEKKIEIIEEKIEVANHRITDIERGC